MARTILILVAPCRDIFFRKSVTGTLYSGISASTFSEKTVSVLLAPVNEEDVEIKPDGRGVG